MGRLVIVATGRSAVDAVRGAWVLSLPASRGVTVFVNDAQWDDDLDALGWRKLGAPSLFGSVANTELKQANQTAQLLAVSAVLPDTGAIDQALYLGLSEAGNIRGVNVLLLGSIGPHLVSAVKDLSIPGTQTGRSLVDRVFVETDEDSDGSIRSSVDDVSGAAAVWLSALFQDGFRQHDAYEACFSERPYRADIPLRKAEVKAGGAVTKPLLDVEGLADLLAGKCVKRQTAQWFQKPDGGAVGVAEQIEAVHKEAALPVTRGDEARQGSAARNSEAERIRWPKESLHRQEPPFLRKQLTNWLQFFRAEVVPSNLKQHIERSEEILSKESERIRLQYLGRGGRVHSLLDKVMNALDSAMRIPGGVDAFLKDQKPPERGSDDARKANAEKSGLPPPQGTPGFVELCKEFDKRILDSKQTLAIPCWKNRKFVAVSAGLAIGGFLLGSGLAPWSHKLKVGVLVAVLLVGAWCCAFLWLRRRAVVRTAQGILLDLVEAIETACRRRLQAVDDASRVRAARAMERYLTHLRKEISSLKEYVQQIPSSSSTKVPDTIVDSIEQRTDVSAIHIVDRILAVAKKGNSTLVKSCQASLSEIGGIFRSFLRLNPVTPPQTVDRALGDDSLIRSEFPAVGVPSKTLEPARPPCKVIFAPLRENDHHIGTNATIEQGWLANTILAWRVCDVSPERLSQYGTRANGGQA